ncbi:MAG TPA: hypothetical protein VLL54_13640 [Pyrinomonadaceae bacterium]|nr:hypothetical protein [Pyrinomonadaceae bacterium]
MAEKTNAQTLGKRKIVESLDREFARLHALSGGLIDQTSIEFLYASVAVSAHASLPSIGECILRSAAAVEQTFGGITANLWDDPFEWTLPEHLSTPAKVREHLAEVESLRQRAFSSFLEDRCLVQHIATPANDRQLLLDLLLTTLLRANSFQARAQLALKTVAGNSPPGFII